MSGTVVWELAPSRAEQHMGTTIIVDIRDPGIDHDVVDRVFDWFRFVDETFSTFSEGSDVSRIDSGELTVAEASPEVREVLNACEALRSRTGGYFDAHVSGHLDPSAFVKGWSVDRAAALLTAQGAENFAVYAGGDVVTRGAAGPEEPWRIGIRHPTQRHAISAIVAAGDLAVATSGAYNRGAHVLDPLTGKPPHGLLSLTVTGPELGSADAFATAAFAMGRDGPAWVATLEGYEMLAILPDLTALITPGFPAVDA